MLSLSEEEHGRRLDWIPRARIGDVWDLEPVEIDPRRFRVRVLAGDVERRLFEVEGTSIIYPAEAMAEDFPGGLHAGSVVTVAQYGPGFGWGVEAQAPLMF